jgi:hypothetical protein
LSILPYRGLSDLPSPVFRLYFQGGSFGWQRGRCKPLRIDTVRAKCS